MKKLGYYLLSVLALVIITQATAFSIYDAPHNEANNINCGDCHGKSLTELQAPFTPIVSPFWDGVTSDEAYNNICLRCHNGSDAPLAITHAPGTTVIKCTICHDNHGQDQVYPGKYNKNNFFIARGTANSATLEAVCVSDTPDTYDGPCTVISYTVPTGLWATNSGSDWFADLEKLADKTETGRGAMLVPTIAWSKSRWPVFEVESVNTTTGVIVVKGDVSAAAELKAQAADFGIFYGQLIRSIITYEGDLDYVQFYDNRGTYSFINQTAATGLCQICHSETNHFQSTLDAAPGGDNHNPDSDCTLCHKHNDVANGGFFPSADHEVDGLVIYPLPATDKCDLCHDGDVISGLDTHESDCQLCHVPADNNRTRLISEIEAAGGRIGRVTSPSSPADDRLDGGTLGGTDGGGTCSECHNNHLIGLGWYFHEVDHTLMGWVTPNTATSSNTVNCTGCHDASSILTGVHNLGASATAKDTCDNCHDSASDTKNLIGSALNGTSNGTTPHEDHTVDPVNECTSCHTAHFDAHDHGTSGGIEHDITFTPAVDHNVDDTLCSACHGADGGDALTGVLDNWDEIYILHNSNCELCHDYTDADSKGTPPLADVFANIPGSGVTCVSCHTPKDDLPLHGGHAASHFGFDAECVACHQFVPPFGVGGPEVVADVHGNICTVCHSGSPQTRDNEKEGDPLNGIDGDAELANGAASAVTPFDSTVYTCKTCHPGAISGDLAYASIHHDSKTNMATGGDCTSKCHVPGTTKGGNHNATVALAINCALCHTGTEGGAYFGEGIPTSEADNKKHDLCTTCHTIDTGDNYYAKLTGSASGKNGTTIGGTDGGGNCAVCHNEYFSSHTNIDHSTSVALDAESGAKIDCRDCHTGTQGSATTVPVDPSTPAGDKKHDSCSTCHKATGVLTAAGGLTTSMPNGSGDGGTDGGGDCTACHGPYFNSHERGNDNKSGTFDVWHDLTYNDTVDLAQGAPGTECAACHQDAGLGLTSLDTWHGILKEHDLDGFKNGWNACPTCHDYSGATTADGTPPVATNDNAIKDIYGPGNTCVTCHTPKLQPATHGSHPADAFGFDGNCADCHGASGNGTEQVVSDIHGNGCTICHSSSAGNRDNEKLGDATNGVDGDAGLADGTALAAESDINAWNTPVCTTCHPNGTYAVPAVHHDSKNGYAAAGNCVQCHNTGTNNTSHAGDHTTLVSLAANCEDCHTGTEGGADNVPVDATDGTKIHDACVTCHSVAGALTGAYGDAQANPVDGGSCETCHTSGFTATIYHGGVDHSGTVVTYVNCSTCHTEVGNTVNPADATVHDSCSACHHADGRLSGSADTHNGGDNGGTNGGGNCSVCHGEYFSSHTNIDHTATVALDSNTSAKNDCFDCHDGTQGTSTTVPLGSGNAKLHDFCSTCHTTTGILTGTSAIATAMPDGGTEAGKDGGSVITPFGCQACHGFYFDSHTHGEDGVHGLTVSYDDLVDRSQNNDIPGNACAVCHNDHTATTGSLDAWLGILYEHDLTGSKDGVGACSTCHDYSGITTGDGTPPVATNDSQIATNTASTCVTCHTPKDHASGASSEHGIHASTDFVNIAQCSTCHWSVAGVVKDVHGDVCTTCHVAIGNWARINGSATNGVDGDARLATDTAATCLTCHPNAVAGTLPFAGIHHDSKNDEAISGNCISSGCHVVSYAGNHTGTVSLATNCADCHNGTQGIVNGVPIDSGNNKKHDECITCHYIDPTDNYYAKLITLPSTNGWVTAMPDGSSTGGTDGGGDCEACHTSGFTGYHLTSVSHDPMVDQYGNCSVCHAGTEAPAGQFVMYPLDPKKHDACSSCHNADGSLTGSADTHNGGANGGTDGGGTCFVCHGEYFASHSNIDHSTSVALDSNTSAKNDCIDCHSGTQGSTTTVPLDASTPAGDKKHDSCSVCHDADGTLTGSATGEIGSSFGGTDGGGTCTACHTTYFDSHSHTHDVSYNSANDKSQAAPGTGCAECHQDESGDNTGLDAWIGILYEHDLTGGKDGAGACATCHDYSGATTADGTPPVATNDNTIASGTSVECLTCHTPKTTPATHGYYDHATNGGSLGYAPITKTASCTDNCHSGEVVVDVHANVCTVCHTTAPTLKSTPNLAQFAGTTTACTDCHATSNDTGFTTPFHGISYAHSETLTRHNNLSNSDSSMTYDCQACHTDMSTTTLKLQKHMATDTVADCYRCHFPNVWGGLSDTPAQTAITTGKGAGSAQTCEDCHTSKDTYLLHGLTAADVASDNEHNNLTTSGISGDTDCANCHTMSTETAKLNLHMSPTNTAHSGDCLTCHTAADDATPSGSASTIITAGKSGGGDAAQTCIGCHIAKGSYLLHGLASNTVNDVHDKLSVSVSAGSGTQTDCANCHAMGTIQNRIDLHLAPTCSTCHTAAGGAVTVIANGWNLGTTANCESCHTGKSIYLRHGLTDDNGAEGVVDVHDQFDVQTGSATSTCSSASCHNTTAGNDIATMQLHTRATTPTTCLTCHQAAAPVSTVIAAGWGSVNPAQCDECHTTLGSNWYAHVVDHTASGMSAVLPEPAGASRTVSCSSTNCHAAQGDIITGVHDIYAPTGGSEPCKECHNSGGTLINGNNGYGNATLGAGGGATCSTCHTSGFDIHLHNHTAKVTFDAATDLSQAAPGTACNQCHGEGASAPYSLASWANKLYEHDFVDGTQDGSGACTSCHDYDTRGNQTGAANTPVANTVTGAIDNNTSVKCLGCHAGKVQPNTHGGHKTADFQWVAGAGSIDSCGAGVGTACHNSATVTNVVSVIHNGAWATGYGTTCQNCHNQPSTATGGNNNTGPGTHGDGTAEITTNGGPANPTTHTEKCTDCHGSTKAAIAAIHHDRTEATGGTCIVCHKPDVGQGASTRTVASLGNITMPRNLPCNYCHLYFASFADDQVGGYDNSGAGSTVKIFSMSFDPDTNFGKLPTVAEVPGHSVSTNTGTPISDYAACFACHGKTGSYTGTGIAGSGPTDLPNHTNESGADRIVPFHGLGKPYTGDSNASGGDLNDVINAYAAPKYAQNKTSPVGAPTIDEKQVGYHPGWDNLNRLACEVGYNCGSTKPYANDVSPGWHADDLGDHDPATFAGLCTSGTFNIPWDNYGAGAGTPGASFSKPFGWRGNISINASVPTVALDLSSCTNPATTVNIVEQGPGLLNKNGSLSANGVAYVSLDKPYPVLHSTTANGFPTDIEFGKVQVGGTLTVFACTPSGNNCTITGWADVSVADRAVNTISGWTGYIAPNGVLGVWHTTGGGQLDFANNGTAMRTVATGKPTSGILNISSSDATRHGNWIYSVDFNPY